MKKYIVLVTCMFTFLYAEGEINSENSSLAKNNMDDELCNDPDQDDESHQGESEDADRCVCYGPCTVTAVPTQPEGRVHVYHSLYDWAGGEGYVYDKDDPFNGFYVGIAGSFGQWSLKRYESENWAGGTSDKTTHMGKTQTPLIVNTGYDWVGDICLLGAEVEGIWFVSKISDTIDGSFLGISYWEHDKIKKPWAVNLNARIGLLMSPYSTLYGFVGPAWGEFKADQGYKLTTTGTAAVSQRDSDTRAGVNVGLGIGTLFTPRIEFHVRGEYSQFSSLDLEEVHTAASDRLSYTPRSVLVQFNLALRL